MNNNPRLIPTTVVNKNGVQTTVYKKPDYLLHSASSIPAPVVKPSSNVMERLGSRVSGHLMPSRLRTSSSHVAKFEQKREAAFKTMLSLPESLLESMLHLIENDDEDESHTVNIVYSLTQKMPETAFNEYVAYHQHLNRDNYFLLLNSLRRYKQLPDVEDYSQLPEDTQRQIHALLTVTKSLYEESRYLLSMNRYEPDYSHGLPITETLGDRTINDRYETVFVAGDDLVQLIMDHPEKADQIQRIIIDRSTGDADLIRSIITTSAPAISAGTL